MYDGMINVRKEKGYTSNDVVAKLRGILHQKKIGHTGTLDPDAEGVLPVCLGKGTKLCDMITDRNKTYEVVMQLGLETDTQDISGTVLRSAQVSVSESQVREAVQSFLGDYMQIPPMYSAIKVGGKKLYELARQGKVVERQPRHIFIFNIDIRSVELPYVKMEVVCSKGTYIRTLCHDVGRKLGCGACMTQLTRTRVGEFSIEQALTLSRIEQLAHQSEDAVREYVISTENMLSAYRKMKTLDAEGDKMLYNGNWLGKKQLEGLDGETIRPEDGCWYRIYDSKGNFIAVYQYMAENHKLKNIKMFL